MNGFGGAPVTRPVAAVRRRGSSVHTGVTSAPSAKAATPAEGGDQASGLRRLMESLGGVVTSEPVGVPEAVGDASTRGVREMPAHPAPIAPIRLARSVAVASGKGGVGKTSLCVNLAVALARRNLRATLIDGDLGLANADVLCGVSPRGHLGHVIRGERAVEDILLDAPGGFRLAPGAGGVAELADLDSASLGRLLGEVGRLESTSDVLVIDCGAGIGRGVMGMLHAADMALIVVTPEPTSMADAYAILKCLALDAKARGEAPRALVVVNQAASEREAAQVSGRIGAVAQRFLGFSPEALGFVPLDEAVRAAVRERMPLLVSKPEAPAARAVVSLADALTIRLGLGGAETDGEGSPGDPGAEERRGRGLVRRLLEWTRRAE